MENNFGVEHIMEKNFGVESAVYYDHTEARYFLSKYYLAWLCYLDDDSITEFLNRLTEDILEEINITKRIRGVREGNEH